MTPVDELKFARELLAGGLADAQRRGLHTLAGAMFAGLSALDAVIEERAPPADPAVPADDEPLEPYPPAPVVE